MPWLAQLDLNYRRDGDLTTAHDRHSGPLRVLQRLYPEGPAVCHHVLVHPPGGVVGGDVLGLDASLTDGAHALITTPGATRFYRSGGATAVQKVSARLQGGARLEWLPAETLAYSGCEVRNQLRFELEPGAEMIGWDLLGLGLPQAAQPFVAGRFEQQIEVPGQWLERGCIDASDTLLLDSPLGLAGHRVLGLLWFATGSPLAAARRSALVDAARSLVEADALMRPTSGVTSAQGGVVLLRLLAHGVEPAMALMRSVRAAWREVAWGLAAHPPRIWKT